MVAVTKKDDRRKKATGGKGGGGTQGRETKTKSTKKKYMAGKRNDSDSEEDMPKPKPASKASIQANEIKSKASIEFMNLKKITELLKKQEPLAESSGDLVQFIAGKLHGPLTEEYQPVLKAVYEKDLASKTGHLSRDVALKNAKRRLSILKMYIEGLKEFEGDIASQLDKYLLRTSGEEAANAVTQVGNASGAGDASQAPPDFMHQCKSSVQLLQELESFLQFKSDHADDVFLDAKEALAVEMESAKERRDPPLFLHLFVLITFSLTNKVLLQASGKFVPHIISILQPKLTPEEFSTLKGAQEAVVANIKSKGKGTSENVDRIYEELENMLKGLKSRY